MTHFCYNSQCLPELINCETCGKPCFSSPCADCLDIERRREAERKAAELRRVEETTSEQIWTMGNVCITVSKQSSGATIASAETEHATQAQVRKALIQEYPELSFIIREERGYWIAQAAPMEVAA